MKQLHELLRGKVVNCQTQEDAREFMEIADKLGYSWDSGGSLIEQTRWLRYGKYTCYVPSITKDMYLSSLEHIHSGYITFSQFKQLLNENNMETKEVKIQVPEGYEIDKENSTFDCIKFKPISKVVTYEDVANELFCHNSHYYEHEGNIYKCSSCLEYASKKNIRCTSAKQAEKLIAINKLMNVAKYLNGEWKPDWNDGSIKYYLSVMNEDNSITIECAYRKYSEVAHFKTWDLAEKAIEVLGEETIKLALSTDW